VILAIGSSHTYVKDPLFIAKKTLDYFPSAVAVADNDGNLPIHTAVAAVKGDACVDIVNLLLDEADRQVKDPSGARFQNKVALKDSDVSVGKSSDVSVAASSTDSDDVVHCNLVLNTRGDTPVMTAIHSRAGWKVINALILGQGGTKAVLCQDIEGNNALHLLVSEEYKDQAAVMCVLKAAPEAATVRNEDGMLPIEIACRHDFHREVILALVLVDLPFELDDLECERYEGSVVRGGSWVFLASESDDHYADIVEEVVSLCSYPQARELCFFDGGLGETLLARATPRCRHILQRSLRFMERFEFVGSLDDGGQIESDNADAKVAFRLFEAIDYGTRSQPFEEGRPVILKCYVSEKLYEEEVRQMLLPLRPFSFVIDCF